MAIPVNPTGLKAQYNSKSQSVVLTWTRVWNAAEYQIQRWNSTLQLYSNLAKVPGNTSYHIDSSSLKAGEQYAYRMLSINEDGNPRFFSTPSNKVWIIDPPEPVDNLTAERNYNDTVGLNWTNKNTPRAPYDYHYIKRWDNVSKAFTQINRIAGGLSYYLDSSAPKDRELKYRIHTSNLIAGGAYYESAPTASVYTTPKTPTNIALRWVGDDVIVSWSNPSTIAIGFLVEHTVDGIEWDPVAEIGKTTSWRHVSAERGAPHRYRIRAITPTPAVGSRAVSPWSTSTWLSAQTTPNAPTLYGPAFAPSGVSFALQYTHNPTSPDSPEAGVQLQHRAAGASTWSATVAGSVVPAQSGTGVVEVRVATRTADSGWSSWSTPLRVQLRARPTPSVGSPTAGAVIAGPILPLAWTVSGQVEWEAELLQGGVVIATRAGTTEKSTTFAVEDASSYTVRLRVSDGYLWSNWVSRSVTTDFVTLAKAQLSSVIDMDRAGVEISYTPNAAFVRVEVLRRRAGDTTWTVVGDTENNLIYDPLPPLRTALEYVAVGWSSSGASSVSEIEEVWIDKQATMINYGPGYGLIAELECGVVGSQQEIERDVTLHSFAGRRLPTEVRGESVRHKVTTSGTLFDRSGRLNDVNQIWESIVDADEHWFRDFTGLSFKASLSRINNLRAYRTSDISLTVEEVN